MIESVDESLEGWYIDPFARHEARWMSQGTPTALVRDGNVETHDPAPTGLFLNTPQRLYGDSSPNGGADLRRADEAEQEGPYDPDLARDRAFSSTTSVDRVTVCLSVWDSGAGSPAGAETNGQITEPFGLPGIGRPTASRP
jgi:hypothetical protein